MRLVTRHSWRLSARQAVALQARLAERALEGGGPRLADIRTVAGLDVCYSRPTDRCYGAVVVVRLPDFETVEERWSVMVSPFPYVPGLLSFREAPSLIGALRRLRTVPDVLLFDAQGRAHPRRLGLASHLGVLYDTSSVGCAKSRLCGEHDEVGAERGDWAPLRDGKGAEVIGSVLRTRSRVKPVYVSVGHRATEALGRDLVLALTRGYRQPEPLRRAHRLSNEVRRAHE